MIHLLVAMFFLENYKFQDISKNLFVFSHFLYAIVAKMNAGPNSDILFQHH